MNIEVIEVNYEAESDHIVGADERCMDGEEARITEVRMWGVTVLY